MVVFCSRHLYIWQRQLRRTILQLIKLQQKLAYNFGMECVYLKLKIISIENIDKGTLFYCQDCVNSFKTKEGGDSNLQHYSFVEYRQGRISAKQKMVAA